MKSNTDWHSKVIIGFTVSSYLALFLVCVYYIKGCVKEDALSDFDKGFLRSCWRRTIIKPSEAWEPALRDAVLIFSDQQLVTGIAVLASGYSQLRCGFSSYNWQIVVYLAWSSSLTHLTTLTALRQYFRDNPALRIWRTVLMVVIVVMLGIALLPTGNGGWVSESWRLNPLGIPALCYFKQLAPGGGFARSIQFGPSPLATMLVSVLGLVLGFMTRLVKLSSQATATMRLWIRTKPGRCLKKVSGSAHRRSTLGRIRVIWGFVHVVLESIYVILRVIFDLYESFLGEVWASLQGLYLSF